VTSAAAEPAPSRYWSSQLSLLATRSLPVWPPSVDSVGTFAVVRHSRSVASLEKVGVLTFHRSINYGSYWQARCLVEGLRRRSRHVELLDHHCDEVRRAELACALQPELPRSTPRSFVKRYSNKVRKFRRAVNSLPLSDRFSLHEPSQAAEYDAVVVGSDEVWNFRHPWFGGKPIFFGEDVRAERLISYAASFGNHSAWDGIDPAWAERLSNFSSISVRDENSRHLVHCATLREPLLVLDPCLQFPDSATAARKGDAGYAVIYGHGFPPWLRRRVRQWADRRKIRLVALGYLNDWADEQLLSVDPLDFAEIMASARAIITNFFHGCIFALLNGKPWVSSPSAYRSIKIPDLVSVLGAQQRLIDEQTSDERIDDLLGTPIQPHVAAKIEQLREQSNAYLDAALG